MNIKKILFLLIFKAIHLRKMFAYNITLEAVVEPIIMLGARWVLHIKK